MAFRFGLNSVLKHRERMEELAQRDFAEAQQAVDAVLQRLEQMYVRQDEVRDEVARIQAVSEPESLEQIRVLEAFIIGHKIRIEKVRQEARGLLQKAEEMQELLIAAATEKKAMAKLKEKRLNEHREHMNRLEAKAMDEQTMMRERWRKK